MKFQQKVLNCRMVGARQSFQIFRQNNWFLKNNRALPKCLYGILHYLISIYQIIIKLVHKKQFCFNHASHLKSHCGYHFVGNSLWLQQLKLISLLNICIRKAGKITQNLYFVFTFQNTLLNISGLKIKNVTFWIYFYFFGFLVQFKINYYERKLC